MYYDWIFTTFLTLLPCIFAGSYLQVVSDPFNQFTADSHPLPSSQIGDVISLSLGFSTKTVEWKGLTVGNIFQRPRAALFISIKSHGDLYITGVPVRQKYPLTLNGDINLKSTRDDILSEFGRKDPFIIEYTDGVKIVNVPEAIRPSFSNFPQSLAKMVPLIQNDGSILEKFQTTRLNMSKPADLNFLSELQLMKEIMEKLVAKRDAIIDDSPDLIVFEISAIAELQSVYGADSLQVNEAENIMSDFLIQYFDAIKALYADDILICLSVLDDDKLLQRFARGVENADAATEEITEKSLNVATLYDPDFSAMFNIILWMSVIIILSVYAAAHMLWFMDPGDSIIYRMTNQRIKLD